MCLLFSQALNKHFPFSDMKHVLPSAIKRIEGFLSAAITPRRQFIDFLQKINFVCADDL